MALANHDLSSLMCSQKIAVGVLLTLRFGLAIEAGTALNNVALGKASAQLSNSAGNALMKISCIYRSLKAYDFAFKTGLSKYESMVFLPVIMST